TDAKNLSVVRYRCIDAGKKSANVKYFVVD
ncbi:unnamed protein product, partial [marine sediment metagenome]